MAGAGVFPKVTGDVIYHEDYNAIKTVVDGVLSTYYGNAVGTTAVSLGDNITADQMDLLRVDINTLYTHITGSASSVTDVAVGGAIDHNDWNAYKTAADYCETNKNTVYAATQLTYASYSTSLTASWNGSHTWTYVFTFPSAAAATYFFQTGGYFEVDIAGDAGSSTQPKDLDWANNILNVIPTTTFGLTQWNAGNGTPVTTTEYGNNAKYVENYCQVTYTRTLDTTVTISVILNDADVGDQTGIGPAVDENVDTDAFATINKWYSYNAVTVTQPADSNTSNW
jgi:hypothetical protein